MTPLLSSFVIEESVSKSVESDGEFAFMSEISCGIDLLLFSKAAESETEWLSITFCSEFPCTSASERDVLAVEETFSRLFLRSRFVIR